MASTNETMEIREGEQWGEEIWRIGRKVMARTFQCYVIIAYIILGCLRCQLSFVILCAMFISIGRTRSGLFQNPIKRGNECQNKPKLGPTTMEICVSAL